MEISVSTGLYYKKNYKEVLDFIQQINCNNIELFLNQTFIDLPLDLIEEEVNKRGLKVTSIHCPLTFLAYNRGEDEEYWLKKGMEYLERLGGKVLVSHFFYTKEGRKYGNDREHFDLMKKYNGKIDGFICTENLPNVMPKTKHQDAERLIQFLSENNCFMTYDTTHVATHGKDILEEYEKYKPYIRNIHVSDFENGNEHKAVGVGELPLKKLIKKLKEDQYEYPLTLELDFENPLRNDVSSKEEAIKLMNESIQYIKDII